MKRLFVVYNPRSSRYSDVQKEVLNKLPKLKGFIIGKYEVQPTSVDDNVTKFAKLLKNGDLVISAGGDATGVICANAILNSNKEATLAVLPYGNFNDLSRTLGTATLEDIITDTPNSHSELKLYPLDIIIDGHHWRYATCYITIGMMGEAVKLYDTPKLRRKLKTNFGRKVGSYTALIGWYFKNRHKKVFLPAFKLNGKKTPNKTSDYAAVNGKYMARVMKGGKDYLSPTIFRSEIDRLTNFWRLFKLMAKSILRRVPGSETSGDVLEFLAPATVEIQAEGEYQVFENIRKIEIRKGPKCLKVIQK